MVPSAQDIEAMRRLRLIMEGAGDGPMVPPSRQLAQSNRSSTASRTGRPDVDAMADILNRFNRASSNTAQRLVEDSHDDPRVREAINTTKTSDGIKIGQYKVTTSLAESAISKSQKVYDVVDTINNTVMCQGLTLSEAAHAVVRCLTKGLTLDHSKVRNILNLEETFSRNRADAVRFRYRYDRCMTLNEKAAASVFSDRFQVARANALTAHDQLKSILESIR